MLFNSPVFLFLFLPIVLIGYSISRRWCFDKAFLIVSSLVFYGYWSRKFLVFLLVAVLVNWLIAGLVLRFHRNKVWLFIGVGINLLLLGVFKYANFFTSIAASLGLVEPKTWSLILPLAISFFTFHQISYLIDISRGDKHLYNFFDYLLYIVFFPHLIAGPIVRHNEFIYQIARLQGAKVDIEMVSKGAVLLILGLAKKVFLADPLAGIVDPLYATALSGTLSPGQTVAAVLGFSLQIYFDFSGYTDMALGLSLMFGYRLPENFNAPYAATSLIEFWRRWHMTLSRFLRDYLYVPFGGNRHGFLRQILALNGTMLLGGLWHGANWTFIIWGVAHGIGLSGNHLMRRFKISIPGWMGWLTTFTFVAVCFSVFRAESLTHCVNLLSGIFAFTSMETTGVVHVDDWLLLIAALGIATIGRTNLAWSDNLVPDKRISLAIGVLGSTCLLAVIATEKNAPFIYFQF